VTGERIAGAQDDPDWVGTQRQGADPGASNGIRVMAVSTSPARSPVVAG
jgi:hypothetical protein